MYTNTLTSISGDDLLVMPSYGKDLILEVSANNDIFFKKGTITKRFDNLVSDYLETSFNSLNSRVEYILQEISGASVKDFITSGISNDLLIKSYDGRDIILEVSGNNEIIFKRGDISYNLDDLIGGGGGGGSSQNSDYAKYNILDITGKIIFTDNSNIEINNDASFNNVHISGSLNVAGTVSASNIYTKSQVDVSLANVYTKSQVDASLANIYTKSQVDASLVNVYTKSQVDASFSNVYTKLSIIDSSLVNVYTRGQVDVSFVSKQLFDASLSSIQLSNVYTKSQVDISFVSRQLFEASYNVLAASNGGGSGGYIQNNDASFNNVDVNGSLKVAGSISASNIYTKSQFDVSFVSKQLFDASLSSIQLTNVYTKNQVDASFISKQYFEASYNVLVSSIGTSGGTSTGTNTGTASTSTIAKKFYNQDWNLLGTNITTVKDISGASPQIMSTSLDGYTVMVYWAYSTVLYPTGVGSQEQRRGSIAVYTFTSNSWIQKGETILLPFTYIPPWRYAENGGADGDATGLPIDIVRFNGKYMSGDGNIIAIPFSRATYGPNTGDYLNPTVTHNVYSFNGITWIQIASETIETIFDVQYFTTYSFENNIIKRFVNDGGTKVTIHTLTNGSFVQDSAQISETDVNTIINVTGSGNFWSRRARSISGDGKVVIFAKEKSIVLFKYNGTIWQQYGNVTLITIPTWFNNFVKLSHDGSVFLAVGWDTTVNGDTNAGMAKIYAYNSSSNTWIQRGQDIVYEEVTFVDEAQGIQYGSDTKILSGDGLTIALGGRNRPWVVINDGGYLNGYLQAYRYSSVTNYWSKIGRELTGVPDERPGQFITSSYNGNVIHIDGQGFKETPTSVNTGRIRVFEIEVDASFSSLSSSYSSSSSSNAYSKTEIDASFANVYTKSQVDASFANIYTKSQVDISFANVYTKSQIDVSFVSKQLFDASINALATSSGGGSSTSIYDTNIKILPDWTPIVEISNSLYNNLGFGSNLSFSKDGSTVASYVDYRTPGVTGNAAMVGRIIVYHYNGSSWVQKGQNLDGTDTHYGNGQRTTLSSDGNMIAIGFAYVRYIYNENGNWVRGGVRIYKYNLTTLLWEQMGSFLIPRISTIQYGTADNELFGESMSFSTDGTIIAIGAPYAIWYNGAVLIYKYETRNSVLDWYYSAIISIMEFQIDINIFGGIQDGPYIYPNNNTGYQFFGSQIALSSDGTVVAGTAPFGPYNDFPDIRVEPPYAGIVRIFKFNGSSWINTGRIVGEYENDGVSSISISLSGNGNIIAIGTYRNSGNGQENGHVRVYAWNTSDNSWNQLGLDIDGQGGLNSEGLYARTGNSISLSYDGTILAVSSTNQGEYKLGRVYKWDGTSWNRYGNGFNPGNSIFLTSDGNKLASATTDRASIVIYNLVQNKIVSLNSTNLFCSDGYSYSYKKNDIKTTVYPTSENSVHSEYYSDFPNKFTRTLYILQNGSLYNRNNTYGSFSDIRLKENIIDATPKLQDLLKVRVVNYNLKGSTNKQIGVLAQELEEIFPGLVETESSGEKYKSVKYSCINIMLVKALQEQQVLINDMSSNINTLKDEITTLKQNMDSLLTRLQALEPNASQ